MTFDSKRRKTSSTTSYTLVDAKRLAYNESSRKQTLRGANNEENILRIFVEGRLMTRFMFIAECRQRLYNNRKRGVEVKSRL